MNFLLTASASWQMTWASHSKALRSTARLVSNNSNTWIFNLHVILMIPTTLASCLPTMIAWPRYIGWHLQSCNLRKHRTSMTDWWIKWLQPQIQGCPACLCSVLLGESMVGYCMFLLTSARNTMERDGNGQKRIRATELFADGLVVTRWKWTIMRNAVQCYLVLPI